MDPLSLVNHPAPHFLLLDREGRPHRLDDWRGRLVVLVFWSPECGHVARLDARLHELKQQAWEDVAVVRIASCPDGTAAEDRLLEACEPILIDEAQQAAEAFGAQVTPHVVVLDAGGIVRYVGAPDDVTLRQRTPTRVYLEEAVQALRSGRLPDPQAVPAFGCAIARRCA